MANNELSRREALWEQLRRFCAFVEEWYPQVTKIRLYGSMLFSESPNDIDIVMHGRKDYMLNNCESLFPDIHMTGTYLEDYTNYKVVWDRQSGFIYDKPPKIEKDESITEIKKLRKQIERLKETVTTLEGTSHKEATTYFGGSYGTSYDNKRGSW